MEELSQDEFLRRLSDRGIRVSAREDHLQISAPAGVLDAELRAELARRKQDLLGALRAADASRIDHNPATEPLVAVERDERIPQTDAQQGLWLIDHFSPGNVAYNIPKAFRVEAAIDRTLLQQAIDGLMERHESLRTSFYEEEGELLQAVSASVEAPVGFSDLSSLPEVERDAELHRQMRIESRRPFQLDHAPLIRFHLFHLAAHRSVVFFNIHHIVGDRPSVEILWRELQEFYQAALHDRSAALAPLPVQYADYALWSHRQLQSEALSGQVEYWKSKLAALPPFLDLLPSRPYPKERSAWGATVPIAIQTPLRDVLNEIGRQENASLFIVLLAIYAVFLFRRSDQRDFCIGTPFTHRKQSETQGIVGLFINMLAIRCHVNEAQNFRGFLRQIRTTALEAYDNSDLPFQEVVRALKPDLRLGRSPLFQVMFNFDSEDRPAGAGPVSIDPGHGTAKFDLTLDLRVAPEGVVGSFEYCTDLFKSADIEHWSRQFVALAEDLAHDPERPLGEVALLPSADGAVAASRKESRGERSGFWSRWKHKASQQNSDLAEVK